MQSIGGPITESRKVLFLPPLNTIKTYFLSPATFLKRLQATLFKGEININLKPMLFIQFLKSHIHKKSIASLSNPLVYFRQIVDTIIYVLLKLSILSKQHC